MKSQEKILVATSRQIRALRYYLFKQYFILFVDEFKGETLKRTEFQLIWMNELNARNERPLMHFAGVPDENTKDK